MDFNNGNTRAIIGAMNIPHELTSREVLETVDLMIFRDTIFVSEIYWKNRTIEAVLQDPVVREEFEDAFREAHERLNLSLNNDNALRRLFEEVEREEGNDPWEHLGEEESFNTEAPRLGGLFDEEHGGIHLQENGLENDGVLVLVANEDDEESEDDGLPDLIDIHHGAVRQAVLLEDENDLPDEILIHHPYFYVACDSGFDEAGPILTACGHRWHKDCVNHCFRIALWNRTSWPPKCCNRRRGIDVSAIRQDLDDDDVRRLLAEREEEYSTANPIYCPKCSNFVSVRPSSGPWTSCCNNTICVRCGSSRNDHQISGLHTTSVCPDKLSAEDRALVIRAGWKACRSCRMLIERRDSCNKMLCSSCKTKFYYKCRKSRDYGDRCGCRTWEFEG